MSSAEAMRSVRVMAASRLMKGETGVFGRAAPIDLLRSVNVPSSAAGESWSRSWFGYMALRVGERLAE